METVVLSHPVGLQGVGTVVLSHPVGPQGVGTIVLSHPVGLQGVGTIVLSYPVGPHGVGTIVLSDRVGHSVGRGDRRVNPPSRWSVCRAWGPSCRGPPWRVWSASTTRCCSVPTRSDSTSRSSWRASTASACRSPRCGVARPPHSHSRRYPSSAAPVSYPVSVVILLISHVVVRLAVQALIVSGLSLLCEKYALWCGCNQIRRCSVRDRWHRIFLWNWWLVGMTVKEIHTDIHNTDFCCVFECYILDAW